MSKFNIFFLILIFKNLKFTYSTIHKDNIFYRKDSTLSCKRSQFDFFYHLKDGLDHFRGDDLYL